MPAFVTGAAAQLPRGRRQASGLTKEEVTRHQRERMLLSMVEAVASEGYAGVAVADVISRAGVSRATFYEQFADKQDCFLAAYDHAVAHLVGSLRPSGGGFEVAALFRAYLDSLAADPSFARVFLVEVYAAGPEGFRRRAASQRLFVELIAGIFDLSSPDELFACEALVAAVSSMVTTRVAEGDFEGLVGLAKPLTRLAESLLGSRA